MSSVPKLSMGQAVKPSVEGTYEHSALGRLGKVINETPRSYKVEFADPDVLPRADWFSKDLLMPVAEEPLQVAEDVVTTTVTEEVKVIEEPVATVTSNSNELDFVVVGLDYSKMDDNIKRSLCHTIQRYLANTFEAVEVTVRLKDHKKGVHIIVTSETIKSVAQILETDLLVQIKGVEGLGTYTASSLDAVTLEHHVAVKEKANLTYGGAKRLVVVKAAEGVDVQAAHKTFTSAVQEIGVKDSTVFGKRANHESEVHLAQGYTHSALMSFDHKEARETAADTSSFAMKVSESIRVDEHITLDYEPTVVKEAAIEYPAVHRVVMVKYKDGAPVEEISRKHAELTEKIPEMQGFEHAELDPEQSNGFHYVAMTTFKDQADRDTFMAHGERTTFHAEHFEMHAESIIVKEFVEEHFMEEVVTETVVESSGTEVMTTSS